MVQSEKQQLQYSPGQNSRLPLSVAVITLNEQENLPRCLESIDGLASEIVVIDSGSSDRTKEVAARFGAVFDFHPWQGHVGQKNVALARCSQPWVLCMDADEAVSPELALSLRALFAKGEPQESGFLLNRFNFYLGQWIRHSWYPEWRLRLVRKAGAEWGGLDPHDKLEVAGAIGRLEGHLLHFPFCSLRDHLQTELKYAGIMADSYSRAGRRFRWYQLVFSPWMALLRILVLKRGFQDGWRGWLIAGSKWLGTFAKYAFLLEQQILNPSNSPTREKRNR